MIVKLQSSQKFVCSSTASAAAVSSADLDVTLSLQVRAVLQFVKPFVCGGSGAHFLILSYSIVANSGLANSRVGRVSLCKSAVRVTWCYASSQQQGYEWDLRTHTAQAELANTLAEVLFFPIIIRSYEGWTTYSRNMAMHGEV